MDAADGTYGRSAFINDFLAFMSGRHRSALFDPLLADT
ncbi:hypothetical protein SAMN05428944_7485 [Streptomyces sp. 1222.5]|nr:hypothetical protein BX260_0606 [Streptomyces sp. 5112.2]SED37842.1 hypothetical protein SAMN05428944_7485 [Streptomyces sp. 1222.5]